MMSGTAGFSRLMAARCLCTWMRCIGVCFSVAASCQSSRMVESHEGSVFFAVVVVVVVVGSVIRITHSIRVMLNQVLS